MNMEELYIYKKEGNRLFSLSQKYNINDTEYQINLKKSCESYGECLNAMIKLESSEEFLKLNSKEINEFNYMKPCIFQNLALANFKLGGYEGCRRCCNAAILYCNKPFYLLDDMGTEDDLTIDMAITEPVLPTYIDILTKSIYRRGQCLQYLEYLELALQDYLLCKRISPNNKVVITSINEVEKMLLKDKQISKPVNNNNNQINEYILDQSDISSITQNGGKCFLRKGYWSQSVTEARTYFPISLLLKEYNQIHTDKINNITSSKLKCEFSPMSMKIFYDNVILFDLFLEYMIVNKSCTWMLETYGNNRNKNESNHPNYLVIYLYKSPSLEWFAGCEWWDRVFAGDEAIETLTCSIGSDVSDLPESAKIKAQSEHERFSKLSKEEQNFELGHLTTAKKSFFDSIQRTKEVATTEDKAIEEVPERAEMLEVLRSQFPNIDFSSK